MPHHPRTPGYASAGGPLSLPLPLCKIAFSVDFSTSSGPLGPLPLPLPLCKIAFSNNYYVDFCLAAPCVGNIRHFGCHCLAAPSRGQD